MAGSRVMRYAIALAWVVCGWLLFLWEMVRLAHGG
jgi:hypothetical protein